LSAGPASLQTLTALIAAFNAHDLDRIMGFFTDDCVLEMPRGAQPWGHRAIGRVEVRDALRSRFDGIPDVHYGDDTHFVCGRMGISQWTLRGTRSLGGERLEVRGCDFYTFSDDGKITKKDSYWKIVER
jgi:ketosteroid isomerase-like protein